MAEAHEDSHEDAYDYTLIDELFSILDTESQGEDIEPILAGYFNKIVQALLAKIKTKLLNYLFIHR
jgi:hypothetical protein